MRTAKKQTVYGAGDVELLTQLRCVCIRRRTTLKAWARQHKLPFSSVRFAILHGAGGVRLRRIAQIRRQVLRDLGE